LPERREERSIVHEHVDLAETLDRSRHKVLHRRLVADVEDGTHDGVRTVLGGDRLDNLGAIDDVRHHHGGALLGERPRVVTPDAFRATGDDGRAAREPSHVSRPGPAVRSGAPPGSRGHDRDAVEKDLLEPFAHARLLPHDLG
jgi:hypothetical protein